MSNLTQKYANEPVWAVVGASNNPRKYGNRIYKTLRTAGYTVYPINKRESEVEGDKAYASLLDLPETPTVVDMVVPPYQALEIVQQAAEAGASAIWFQPGAEDAEAINWAKANGLDVVEDCILVQHVQSPQGDSVAA